MEKAKKFVEFCKKNGRFPELDGGKEEYDLSDWHISVKYSSRFEPDVRDYLLSEVPDFFKLDIEIDQMEKAQKFVEFYKDHNRLPIYDNKNAFHPETELSDWRISIMFSSRIKPDVRDYLLSEVPDFFNEDI